MKYFTAKVEENYYLTFQAQNENFIQFHYSLDLLLILLCLNASETDRKIFKRKYES